MDGKILVVCFSRGGTTLKVARHLADALGADLESIEEISPRTGVMGYLRSAIEAAAKGLPTIRTRRDPGEYEFVVLGTPVWTGTMASPMRSYIHAHRAHLRNAAFFAVMGGRGAEETVREMQLACAGTGPACVLTQREVDRGKHEAKCDEFVRAILAERGKRSRPRTAA